MPIRAPYPIPLLMAALLALGAAGPAAAQDPFVYRDCMVQCKEFKDRGCCNETCGYTACIADKTRAGVGHGTSKDGIRLEQTDPGAWSAAMAACYPWIEILKGCHSGTPGTPPAAGAPSAGAPAPGQPPAPVGRIVLRRVGEPKLDGSDANWPTVRSSNILQQGYGYKGTYTWDEPPVSIGENGFPTTLKVVAECSNGQRMATGLSINGEFDLFGTDSTKATDRLDYPANCESKPNAGHSAAAGGTVRVVPRKNYAPGSKVKIRVGAFWGRGVEYFYEPVAP